MWQFNTFFLLKATAVAALCCLPMAYNQVSGFVWTAFLLPICLACLAAAQIGKHGQFEFQFKELSDSAIELFAAGGRQTQWLARGRTIGAGACLSIAIGFPVLHIADPEPPAMWLPVVLLFAVGAVVAVGYSARRMVLTAERQFVTDYLLFDRLCWRRRRWQVRDGDFLAVRSTWQAQVAGMPQYPSRRALFVCRSRRRQIIGLGAYTDRQIFAEMELAAQRVARLVDLPYEGCHN